VHITKVLLQVGLDIETMAANRCQQQFGLDVINLAFSSYLQLLKIFRLQFGLDVIKYPTCSNTEPLYATF